MTGLLCTLSCIPHRPLDLLFFMVPHLCYVTVLASIHSQTGEFCSSFTFTLFFFFCCNTTLLKLHNHASQFHPVKQLSVLRAEVLATITEFFCVGPGLLLSNWKSTMGSWLAYLSEVIVWRKKERLSFLSAFCFVQHNFLRHKLSFPLQKAPSNIFFFTIILTLSASLLLRLSSTNSSFFVPFVWPEVRLLVEYHSAFHILANGSGGAVQLAQCTHFLVHTQYLWPTQPQAVLILLAV